uniref:Uncharacterized protein n=1 Tax=Anguilla anguilla TaxID=7936 RepID=A0A0E9T6C4_ANGAN
MFHTSTTLLELKVTMRMQEDRRWRYKYCTRSFCW